MIIARETKNTEDATIYRQIYWKLSGSNIAIGWHFWKAYAPKEQYDLNVTEHFIIESLR